MNITLLYPGNQNTIGVEIVEDIAELNNKVENYPNYAESYEDVNLIENVNIKHIVARKAASYTWQPLQDQDDGLKLFYGISININNSIANFLFHEIERNSAHVFAYHRFVGAGPYQDFGFMQHFLELKPFVIKINNISIEISNYDCIKAEQSSAYFIVSDALTIIVDYNLEHILLYINVNLIPDILGHINDGESYNLTPDSNSVFSLSEILFMYESDNLRAWQDDQQGNNFVKTLYNILRDDIQNLNQNVTLAIEFTDDSGLHSFVLDNILLEFGSVNQGGANFYSFFPIPRAHINDGEYIRLVVDEAQTMYLRKMNFQTYNYPSQFSQYLSSDIEYNLSGDAATNSIYLFHYQFAADSIFLKPYYQCDSAWGDNAQRAGFLFEVVYNTNTNNKVQVRPISFADGNYTQIDTSYIDGQIAAMSDNTMFLVGVKPIHGSVLRRALRGGQINFTEVANTIINTINTESSDSNTTHVIFRTYDNIEAQNLLMAIEQILNTQENNSNIFVSIVGLRFEGLVPNRLISSGDQNVIPPGSNNSVPLPIRIVDIVINLSRHVR